MKLKTKGQQEIVGFIIIVLMVLIVAVIFLGIWLRPKVTITNDDIEINNLLVSSLDYTSDCYRNEENKFLTNEALISRCFELKECANGKKACDILNYTYTNLLFNVLSPNDLGHIKYYKFSIYYATNSSDQSNQISLPNFPSIIAGNLSGCTDRRLASTKVAQIPGAFIVNLEICKNT